MTTGLRLGSALVGGLLLTACSAATRGPGSARCVPEAIDSTWALAGPVYRNCDVDRQARQDNMGANPPDYTPTRACETAVFAFVVDTAGLIERLTARAVGGNSPAFAQAIAATMSRWRFRPAIKGGVAVRQVVWAPFAATRTVENPSQLRQPRVSSQVSCIP